LVNAMVLHLLSPIPHSSITFCHAVHAQSMNIKKKDRKEKNRGKK